jgi:hypothetical protein
LRIGKIFQLNSFSLQSVQCTFKYKMQHSFLRSSIINYRDITLETVHYIQRTQSIFDSVNCTILDLYCTINKDMIFYKMNFAQ